MVVVADLNRLSGPPCETGTAHCLPFVSKHTVVMEEEDSFHEYNNVKMFHLSDKAVKYQQQNIHQR